ncbi:MAG: hypothetical protein U1G07_18225 [Verrucomicrobiota bacterium]
MRTWLVLWFLGCSLAAEAHVGSPNVVFEGHASAYPVRVIIRPPQVVPGLAEIAVRAQGPVRRITVLPVFGKAGREGSPSPDEARPVPGETNLYAAQLWLMKSGAYSVDVTVEHPEGTGTLVVPVNSTATNTKAMSSIHVAVLSVLGGVLFLSAVGIAGAVFGQCQVPAGTTPTRKDLWRGRAAMALSALALALLLLGGKKWWDVEDRHYRNNVLYKPSPLSATVHSDHQQWLLTLGVDTAVRRGGWIPLIPDHGKLMHLFLVSHQQPGSFAHLHPKLRGEAQFDVPLPPLPAGAYHAYADVTHEDGFAETLVGSVQIPPPSDAMRRLWLANAAEPVCSTAVSERLATNLFYAPDPDDSWQVDSRGSSSSRTGRAGSQIATVAGGYQVLFEPSRPLLANVDDDLRFKLLTPAGNLALIEPYMGMLGHAVIRRADGAVFAHLHPSGTISMAAHEFFLSGKPVSVNVSGSQMSTPALESHSRHVNAAAGPGEIAFPYAFPKAGNYRLWVQMRSEGQIFTAAFDVEVGGSGRP